MKKIYISLDDHEIKPWLQFTQIFFGIVCFIISGIWIYYMLDGDINVFTFWVATFFLLLFGLFQIYSGAGLSKRFVVFDEKEILLKQSTFGKKIHLLPGQIKSIEIGAAEIIFDRVQGSRIVLKLGLRYFETGETIKEKTELFARENQIMLK